MSRSRGRIRPLLIDLTQHQPALTLEDLNGDLLPLRLRNSAARLLQPYL